MSKSLALLQGGNGTPADRSARTSVAPSTPDEGEGDQLLRFSANFRRRDMPIVRGAGGAGVSRSPSVSQDGRRCGIGRHRGPDHGHHEPCALSERLPR